MGRPAVLSIRLVAESKEAQAELTKVRDKLEEFQATASKADGPLLMAGAVGELTLALLPLAAALTDAGAGVAAFGVAVIPQFQAITKANQTLAKAQSEQAQGLKSATATMAEYQKQIAAIPPATLATSKAFDRLKTSYAAWSDLMAPKTMPVFTTAINGLREALPALTPLVEAAAAALKPFVDDFEHAAASGAIGKWTTELSSHVEPVLTSLLSAAEHVGHGLGVVFLGMQDDAETFVEKFDDVAKRFDDWASSPTSIGPLTSFEDQSSAAADAVGGFVVAVLKLAADLSPFFGTMTELLSVFDAIVRDTPTWVIDLLAGAFLGFRFAVIGMDVLLWAYAAAVGGVEAATWLWVAAQDALDLAMDANPIGAIILLAGGFAAAITWMIDELGGWSKAWDEVKDAVSALWDYIVEFFKWLGDQVNPFKWLDGITGGLLGYAAPTGGPANRMLTTARTGSVGSATFVSPMLTAVHITIDGQQLQGRIDRTVNSALTRDGARLSTLGWN